MAKYLLRAKLSTDGVKGVLSEGGTARQATVSKTVEGLGGSVEAFYFAFGDDDVIVICDLPDNETAAAVAMNVSSSGRVSVSTTVLVTPEEIDRSREKQVDYRPPGG